MVVVIIQFAFNNRLKRCQSIWGSAKRNYFTMSLEARKQEHIFSRVSALIMCMYLKPYMHVLIYQLTGPGYGWGKEMKQHHNKRYILITIFTEQDVRGSFLRQCLKEHCRIELGWTNTTTTSLMVTKNTQQKNYYYKINYHVLIRHCKQTNNEH